LGGTSSLGTGSITVELYTYNLPHVIDLTALAILAELVARVQTATGPYERESVADQMPE
jgi:hypothetical protein